MTSVKTALRTARLLGRHHHAVGAVACIAEGPAAIALSIGGAPKAYEHTDPNEDAVGFALGPAGALVAVGDAHKGATASEAVVAHLLDACAPAWTSATAPDPERWGDVARAAVWEAHMEARRGGARPDRQGSRTTLALALFRPEESLVFWASVGDSLCFRVDAGGAEDLAFEGQPCAPRYFLGSESLTRAELADHSASGAFPTAGVRSVVLATDGLSEVDVGLPNPEHEAFECVRDAAAAAPELRPLEATRALAERANAAHRENPSGDNIAVATLWLTG
jgi:serine/threonine protein phosphatase PrpC